MTTSARPFYRNRSTLISFVLLLIIFLVINFAIMAPYLLAILMGSILSVLSQPFYKFLLKKKCHPKISAGIVVAGILVVLIGPLFSFSAIVIDQGIDLANTVSKYDGFSLPEINRKLSQLKPVRTLIGDASALDAQMKSAIQTVGKTASGVILAIVSKLPNIVLQLLLAIVACYFFLVDGKRFFNWLKDKMPLDPGVRDKLFRSFKDTAISSVWATILAATVQSVIMFSAFAILGVPATFLAAGATFFFAWIPILGSTPVWTSGALYLWANGSPGKALAMLGFGALTGVSDNFVYPMVLKGRGDMHPLVGLIAIFGGLHMFGLFGVFFGPILVAILISLLNIWPEVRQTVRA